MLICRTPLRVSLFGGGSDFPEYFKSHTGAVLSFSIKQYIYTSVHPLIESKKILLKYSKNELVNSFEEIQHPVFREILSNYQVSGIDIAVSSDIAAGTGLGSSSAFTVSVIHLVREFLGLKYSKESLAQEACYTEINKLGEPIGMQDQYASAFGGLNLLEFNNSGKVDVTPIAVTAEVNSMLMRNFILIRVGGIRSAGKLLGIQSSLIQLSSKEEVLASMVGQAREVFSRIEDGPQYLGEMLHKAWTFKKSLSPLISNKLVDDLYNYLLELGIYGGKLLGAGGSGYFLAVGEEEVTNRIRSINNLSTLDISLDSTGSEIIYRSDN